MCLYHVISTYTWNCTSYSNFNGPMAIQLVVYVYHGCVFLCGYSGCIRDIQWKSSSDGNRMRIHNPLLASHGYSHTENRQKWGYKHWNRDAVPSPQYEKHPHSMVPMMWKFPTKPFSRRLFNMGDGIISKIRSLVHPLVMSGSIFSLLIHTHPTDHRGPNPPNPLRIPRSVTDPSDVRLNSSYSSH